MNWALTLGPVVVRLDAVDPGELPTSLGDGVWNIEAEGGACAVVFLPNDTGFEVWWRGRRFELRLERADVYALRAHFSIKQQTVADGHHVCAHMPGLVAQVRVEAGEAVTRGQPLFVLEAMKMENEIRAPGDGVVAELHAAAGQQVEKGALLCLIRAPEGSG